jgi:uncharacterized protein (DUF433 family)
MCRCDLGRRYDHGQLSSTPRRTPITRRAPNRPQLGTDDPRIARAVFNLRETAAYLDLSRSTVHRWAQPGNGTHPLITSLPTVHREATIPFIGFAEAYVLSSFRKAGLPLQRIRPAVEILAKEIGVDHALASKSLYTDGAEVLFDYGSRNGSQDLMDLTVVRTQQRQFTKVVKGYLKRIEYGGDGWAESIRLSTYSAAEVIVDPRVGFGLPLLATGGARVEDLVDRFQAGDSVGEIAADFGVPADQVEDVIRVATRAAA